MSEPITSPHPSDSTAVRRYLDDLGRMLVGTDPTERADALGSVREYIDDSVLALDHTPEPADYARILEQLGSPTEVAADLFERGLVSDAPGNHDSLQTVRQNSKLGSFGLGFGIGAILLSLVPLLGGAVALAAIIVGVVALKLENVNRTHSKVGIWLGAIALLVQIVMLIMSLAALFLYAPVSSPQEVESVPAVVQAPASTP